MSLVPYSSSRLSNRSYGIEPYTGSRLSEGSSYGRSLSTPRKSDFLSSDIFSKDRSRRRSNFIDGFFSSDSDDIFDSVFSGTRNLFGQMDRMMGSMMRDPFGEDPFFRGQAFPTLMVPPVPQPTMTAVRPNEHFQLSPFVPMMSSMENMMKEGSCHSFSSSSVMTMTTGPDGRPQAPLIMQKSSGNSYNWRESGSRATQIRVGGLGNHFDVYQASSSTREAPGGVRETQRSMADSRTGLRKMAIGHHIEDRSHVIEKELRDGELEEKQEFVNLDETDAADFDREFKRKTHQALGAIDQQPRPRHRNISPSRQRSTYLPALPSSTSYRRRAPRPVLAITSSASRTNDRARNRERGVGRTRPNNPSQ